MSDSLAERILALEEKLPQLRERIDVLEQSLARLNERAAKEDTIRNTTTGVMLNWRRPEGR